MRTVRTKIYKFDELSDKAKQVAIEAMTPDHNPWQHENTGAIKKFAELFGLQFGRDGFKHADLTDLEGVRLANWFWNNYRKELYKPKQYWICEGRANTVGANAKHRNRNSKIFLTEDGCPLSGLYIDNYIIKPIFDFMRKPTVNYGFNDIMSFCFDSWAQACEKDWEYQCSEGAIIETIQANEYEFYANGKQHF